MQKVLDYFEQISRIPRASQQEDKISAFMIDWAKANDFSAKTDSAGNLLITVPASPGQETAPTIILQSHMDMVCEKTPDSSHDFAKDPLRLVYDGDWLSAKQTTLGADNGAGLAIAMAVAEDKELCRPRLELLCTVDEESGLTGANLMEPGFISGKILINLDSEDEGIFTIGCAGGRDIELYFPVEQEPCSELVGYELKVHGLQGGHSGINIGDRRANANVLLARVLNRIGDETKLRLSSITGGSVHNAIPRDAQACLAIPEADQEMLVQLIQELEADLKEEYSHESNLAISFTRNEAPPDQIIESGAMNKLFGLLLVAPNGVMAMSKEIDGLVETSVNFATIREQDGHLRLLFSQRSSRESKIDWLTTRIEALARFAGAKTNRTKGYPSWQPNMKSELLARSQKVYQDLFKKEPKVEILHAGLECGIIGAKNEGMDMISFGPTIESPHSPQERLFIPSLEKVRQFTQALIASYTKQTS